MHTLNGFGNKKEKSYGQQKTNDVTNSYSWFSSLKKSFINRKHRTKSSDDKHKSVSNGENVKYNRFNSRNDYDFSTNETNCGDQSNFSNEFLDSFVKKKGFSFCNDNLKSKLKTYHQRMSTNPKSQMNVILNTLFSKFSEQTPSIENVLMSVVEDYINSTCEKMLHDKMKSVYKKIEGWSRNPITRPGFKNTDSGPGGNITKPEKSFVIQQNSKYNKCDYVYLNSHIRRKSLLSRDKDVITDDFKLPSSVNHVPFEESKTLKSVPKPMVGNSFIDPFKPSLDRFTKNNKIGTRPNTLKDKYKKVANNDSNFILFKSDLEKKKKSLSFKSFNNMLDYKSKLCNHTPLSEYTESNSNCDSTNKLTITMSKDISNCKCSENSKLQFNSESHRCSSISSNRKILKVSKVVNVDIKPSVEKFNNKIISRIPKHCSRLSKDISRVKTSPENTISLCTLKAKKSKEISLHQIIRPKIRRSVTFVEPRNSLLNTSLSKEMGFCSQWEVRSEVNKSGFLTSTKSEEINYIISSNNSIPDLCETYLNNCDQIINHPNKTDNTNSFYAIQSINNNDRNIKNDIIKDETEKSSNTIKIDNKKHSFSPIIISLQSTPSFIGDVNYPYTSQCSPEHSVEHFLPDKTSVVDKLNLPSEIDNSNYQTENIHNMLKSESNRNTLNKDFDLYKANSNFFNTKNYSIVEIINKLPLKPDDEDETFDQNPTLFKRRKNPIHKSKITTQIESFNTSFDSSLSDEDVLISTGSTKSPPNNKQLTNLHEIILSDDEEIDPQVTSLFKKKRNFMLAQMKTANFSSLKTRENNLNCYGLLNKLNPSFLSLSHNYYQKDNDANIHSQFNIVQENPEIAKPVIEEPAICKTDKNNNLLKHTLASKQKMRDKVTLKTNQEKNPMKFSKGITKT